MNDTAKGDVLPRGIGRILACIADRVSNRAERHHAPARAKQVPFLADLHCDTLLWGIDPCIARRGGHVDLPRLVTAGADLQVFAAPTWTPLPLRNKETRLVVTHAGFDQVNLLFPLEFLTGFLRKSGIRRRRRASRIAARFGEMLERAQSKASPCDMLPIYGAEDLARLGQPAHDGRPVVGALLALEGLHWLAPDADAETCEAEVARLYAEGFRMIAPTHRFANGLGAASEHSGRLSGLTDAGRRVLRAAFDRGIAVDVAHASSALIAEASGLALSRDAGPRPILISHAGIRAEHETHRNLTKGDILNVARTGGVIGIGYWHEVMGYSASDNYEDKLNRIVRSFISALRTLQAPGVREEMEGRFGQYDPYEHLALGSDFDGAVTTPFDITGVPAFLEHLANAPGPDGPIFPPDKLALIAGLNAKRVLHSALSEPA